MPTKKKSTRKAKPAAPAKRARPSKIAKPAKSVKSAEESAPAVRRTTAELHFTETTIIRGEAVEPGKEVPSGATHEIAGHDASGQPILKRKRFSIC
jgi:hypothetical protein